MIIFAQQITLRTRELRTEASRTSESYTYISQYRLFGRNHYTIVRLYLRIRDPSVYKNQTGDSKSRGHSYKTDFTLWEDCFQSDNFIPGFSSSLMSTILNNKVSEIRIPMIKSKYEQAEVNNFFTNSKILLLYKIIFKDYFFIFVRSFGRRKSYK